MTIEMEDAGEEGGKSSLEDELNALTNIVKYLEPLTDEGRAWVLSSAASRFGTKGVLGKPTLSSLEGPKAENQSYEENIGNVENPKVKKWVKDAGFTEEELESVFYQKGGEYQIIASDVPGKSKKDKTINAYILVGAAKFLEAGEPNFTDQEARAYCESIGCYDTTNHSKYMKDKGNSMTGSKSGGWTLTMPGLKAAVEVIRGAQ